MKSGSFIPTLDIMAKLKERLSAMKLDADTPLFEKVEFYSHPNLVAALADLRITKTRVCLIVPAGDDFTTQARGAAIQTNATTQFVLLLADRDYGNRQRAATGDANTPGVVKMKDIVIKALYGDTLDFKPHMLRLVPVDGDALVLQEKERDDLPGREAWQITWQCDAGEMCSTPR